MRPLGDSVEGGGGLTAILVRVHIINNAKTIAVHAWRLGYSNKVGGLSVGEAI